MPKFEVRSANSNDNRTIEFYLQENDRGGIDLLCDEIGGNEGSGWYILEITPDGRLELATGIDGEFVGLDVDDHGVIIVSTYS